MNTQWSKIITAGIMVTGMIILGCTSFVTMGPGSETVAVAGRVVDSLGRPVSQTPVMLLPSLYNPLADPAIPDSMRGITNEVGDYILKAPGPGAYSVEAADSNSKCKSLVTGITIRGKDTVTVRESVLHATGALRVVLPDTMNEASGYVYLPGTTCLARTRNGSALIDGIPAGFIPAAYYEDLSAPARNHVIQTNLTVSSNDTQVVADVNSLKYSKKLYLNTTAGGAGVGRNVYGFPVLVRLTSVNFDFTRAKNNGGDLRFTKPDHTPLPCEIERWDPVTELAEVWVKVDTVYGNDSAHSFTMYWGDPAAGVASNSAAVFDTAAGFAGVWHLGESEGAAASDATVNGINGTATATTPVAGIIGTAQMFNGTSSVIEASGPASDRLNFQDNDPYSLCAWVNASVIDTFHAIVFKSNFQYGLEIRPEKNWEFFNYASGTGWQWAHAPATAGSWHLVTGVWSGSQQYLYVDGTVVDSARGVTAWSSSRVFSAPFQIGNCPDGAADVDRHFNGAIDEVRVEKTARNADWIRLCYMNQKEQDALVKW